MCMLYLKVVCFQPQWGPPTYSVHASCTLYAGGVVNMHICMERPAVHSHT